MKKELTKRESDVLVYINEYTKEKGYSPSIRDICEGVGIKSTSGIHEYIHRLEYKGYIKLGGYGHPRSISLL